MEEFHASLVVLPLRKYHSTSTIVSSHLRLAVRGAVYPQSCRRERFAARRRLAASRKFALPPGTGFLPPETGAPKAPQRRYLRTETGNRRPPRARNGPKSSLRACRSKYLGF